MGIHELGDLLIHSDTDDESTTFTDSSGQGHTLTPTEDVHHETDEQKFGATGIYFDGVGKITTPDSSDFDFAKADFTIDLWVYPTSFSSYRGIIGTDDGSTHSWTMYTYTNGQVKLSDTEAASTLVTSGSLTLTLNTWNHIALIRKGTGATDLNIYIGGVAGDAPATGDVTIDSSGVGLGVGVFHPVSGSFPFSGYMDEIHIVKGSAEWTANFTPWTQAYYSWDGTIQTPEIIINLSNSSDTQISIGSPEAAIEIIQAPGDLFLGLGIESPEIIIALSNSTDVQIGIGSPESSIVVGSSTDVQIGIGSPEVIINSSHSIGDIFTGALIITPEIVIASSAATDIGLLLSSPEIIITSDHDSNLAILFASPEIITSSTIETAEEPASTFTTIGAGICYLFSLTKVSGIPDIEIPISSFQSRLRDGDPSYLSVVIPGLDYSGAISVRADADMVVEMAYKRDGSYIQREEIARVTLESVIIYQGAKKQSIVLSGHRTNTYPAKGFRTRQSPTHYTLSANGKATYRFPRGDMGLNPGDSFTVGADVFEVGLITHIIGGNSPYMEVTEA